jgi:hypothetical protein
MSDEMEVSMKNYYPIGTVVLLNDSSKRLVIIGYCQMEVDGEHKIWDYAGCLFPEGYLGAEKTFLFDNEQIDKVFYLGLQDEEQLQFNNYLEETMEKKKFKNKENE